MNNTEFVNKLVDIAKNYKTLYVMGCFGAPLNSKNKARYTKNCSYNKQTSRTNMINAASNDTFGFDCVCLIKGVLWGWCGDLSPHLNYGGATYESRGVPDIGADAMINECSNVTTDFSKISVGEAVWMSGHIGIYIGNGLAVECSPKWANKVQITACNCTVSGYNRRDWTKHGKLPYVTYAEEPVPTHTLTPIQPHGQIRVKKSKLAVRGELKFSNGKPSGTILAIAELGGVVNITGAVQGIQPDGYIWLNAEYYGKKAYVQYDPDCYEMENCILKMYMTTTSIRIRSSLGFDKNNKPNGQTLKVVDKGDSLTVVKPLRGKQKDGYMWVWSEKNGTRGYSQYDPKAYTLGLVF